MKLTVLVDNNTLIGRYFQGEPGISFFIEEEDKKILFDTGYSDAFLRNAQKMRLDLLYLDYVILSHGHLDHTWGLASLIKLYTEATYEKIEHNKPVILTHPMTFISKSKNDLKEVGSKLSQEKLSKIFKLNLSKDPVWITDNLVFLGQIPRKHEFEGKRLMGDLVFNDHTEEDYMIEDSALAYNSSKGIVIITGCSHSGICNIIEHAKQVCKNSNIIDIIGGFHLLNPRKEQLLETLNYIKKHAPLDLHACHCTDLNSKIALSHIANIKEVGIGLKLEHN